MNKLVEWGGLAGLSGLLGYGAWKTAEATGWGSHIAEVPSAAPEGLLVLAVLVVIGGAVAARRLRRI